MRFSVPILLLVILFSCEVKVSTDKKDSSQSKSGPKSKIRNGIEFTAIGVKVEQAFLTYDDGPLVDENNLTSLQKPIVLNLVIDGWKADGDSVYLGAGEKISASDGTEIMNYPDLFEEGNIKGVSKNNAKYITLQVVINKINMLVDYFLVEFKAWNKRARQSVTGHYKFHIKEI